MSSTTVSLPVDRYRDTALLVPTSPLVSCVLELEPEPTPDSEPKEKAAIPTLDLHTVIPNRYTKSNVSDDSSSDSDGCVHGSRIQKKLTFNMAAVRRVESVTASAMPWRAPPTPHYSRSELLSCYLSPAPTHDDRMTGHTTTLPCLYTPLARHGHSSRIKESTPMRPTFRSSFGR